MASLSQRCDYSVYALRAQKYREYGNHDVFHHTAAMWSGLLRTCLPFSGKTSSFLISWPDRGKTCKYWVFWVFQNSYGALLAGFLFPSLSLSLYFPPWAVRSRWMWLWTWDHWRQMFHWNVRSCCCWSVRSLSTGSSRLTASSANWTWWYVTLNLNATEKYFVSK